MIYRWLDWPNALQRYIEAKCPVATPDAAPLIVLCRAARREALLKLWRDYGIAHGGPPNAPLWPQRAWAIASLPNTIIEVENLLVTKSQKKECVSYDEVEACIQREDRKPWGARHRVLGVALAVISTESWWERRVMLSAVVVGAAGDPGPGFKKLGRSLGNDRAGDQAAERDAVYQVYDP